MKTSIFVIRYNLAALLIHVGLNIMPDSAYKRELLRRMWELRWEVEAAVDNYKKEHTNGEQ